MPVGNVQCLKLEDYRNYLLLLVRMQLASRPRVSFDASDLVQATLLKAHEQRHRFRGQSDGEVQAWLRCILAGTLADAFRREHRGKRDVARVRSLEAALEQSSGQLLQWLAGPSLSPSQKAMHNELLLEMVNALAQLPEAQREAVMLHYLQGLSISKVSERIGRSPASVAGLLQRGLKALRKLIPRAE